MGSIYGSNSVLFFHFKSRTTATIQTAVLDAAAVLAHAEKVSFSAEIVGHLLINFVSDSKERADAIQAKLKFRADRTSTNRRNE